MHFRIVPKKKSLVCTVDHSFPVVTLGIIYSMGLAVVFFFFTASILSESLYSIRSNTTYIDLLKNQNFSDENGFECVSRCR